MRGEGEGNGIVVQYAPRFPILLNFRESDEEFPCSGKAFVDANAHRCLMIEAVGGDPTADRSEKR